MKRLQRVLWIFCVLLLIAVSNLYAQNSNIGTEFWTGWMDHINSSTAAMPSQMNLYLTGDVATTATISSAGTDFTTFTVNITPGSITKVPIAAATFLGNTDGGLHGIHIVSVKPIAAYAHIYASAVSGATLLLPVNTLSNDYYSLNYTQVSNAVAYSTFMVIATEDSTTIQVKTVAALLDGHAAGSTFKVSLRKGEIYQGVSGTDLTGSHITSVSTATQNCKRIAVFSGSSKIKIGSPNQTSDNLFQQVYPTPTWGKNYITVPTKSRNYDVYRVVVSDSSAVVKVDGVILTGLINNFYYEYNAQTTHFVTADKPIQVVQYAVTQGNSINGTNISTDVGDPEMIYLNPLEQNIDHVTLYSASEYAITNSFINVVIPTAAASSFLLDGTAPAGGFTAVPSNTTYSYGQFSVTSGTSHTISASQGFNAIAYGFGNAESYGYAAGTNVRNLNEFVQVINHSTSVVATTGCTNAAYNPELALPYQPLSLVWDLGNGDSTVTQKNPTYKQTIRKNDTTLYIYDYGKAVVFKVGIYPIKIIAEDPISTSCGTTEEIDYDYTVVDPPQALFTSRDTVCRADTVMFTDKTPAAVSVSTWHWDFGSGVASDTSNVQNPLHKFLTSGTYTVMLTATGSTGCNTSYAKKVYVRVLPIANFSIPDPVCDSPLAVTFIDSSVPSEGKLTSWFWDFGDGTTSLRNSAAAFTHKFATSQTYKVTLTVTTDKSCTSSLPVSKLVNFSPLVDFVLPDACQTDNVKFTSTTTVADSTADALTYSWNFDDPTNTGSPNTASTKVAYHHFNKVGNYNIKLTVTTKNGCIADTIKVLTVNGSNPKAVFKVITPLKTRCSNQNVVFENDSYIPTFNGKVTSFNVDFGDGAAIQTFRVDSGATFTHKFPTTYTFTKLYTVMMTAFSGVSLDCQNVFTDTLSVQPVPKPAFALPDSICQNFGKLYLASTVTTETGTPTGTPVFYIDGIKSPNGIFNTQILGTGTHTVTCDYIATSTGCDTVMVAKIKIEPIAAVDAGQDIYILAGATAQLKPNIIGGNSLTYLWTPSTGLNDATLAFAKAAPTVTTTYKLTVTSTTDKLACPVSDSVKVIVLQAPVVPNTFTPNDDGKNDVWYIKELSNYPGCIVEVYNRNGERVFYSIGYLTPWDGRYNSVNLPVGVYYYIIDPKNGRDKMTGSVTIIR